MPCITIPAVTIPDLPFPLTLALPELPSLPGLPNFCCKLPPLPVSLEDLGLPPIIIPSIVINPALIITLKKYRKILQKYLDARPLNCPKE